MIAEHRALADALGGTPSEWACYRFTVKLRENAPLLAGTLDQVIQALAAALPGMGEHVAIDASDLPAYVNGQRTLTKNGPERERYSDPDASWGHRSAVSTRKGGGFYGYRIHAAVCSTTGLPLAWRVQTAREHETVSVEPLLDTLAARGLPPRTVAMGKGYDNGPIYDACAERGVVAISPFARLPPLSAASAARGVVRSARCGAGGTGDAWSSGC